MNFASTFYETGFKPVLTFGNFRRHSFAGLHEHDLEPRCDSFEV
jgi:hypothetical protein